ncbi:MAG: deaminase [Verrucomicrobiota bacterium]
MSLVPDVPSDSPLTEPTSRLLDDIEIAVTSSSTRPSWDEYFMATALLISTRSSCERLHVGAVLVSGGEHRNRIIAAGYNGFLPGHPHESRVRENHEQGTVHAEQNAIADAARRGISVQGATVYVTHFPCINCTKILLSAGIACIKYRHDYKNDPIALELLQEAGVEVIKLS